MTPKRFCFFAVAALALLLSTLVLAGPAAHTSVAAGSGAVNITDFTYKPATITVPVGSVVTWTNQGNEPHTVTSDSGAWDSGTIQPTRTFSVIFNTPGSFAYHCVFHSIMHGTVIVTEEITPTPTPTGAGSSPPTLTGPANGATLDSFGPTLTWSNPPDTTQYHLQVIPVNNDGPGVDLHVGSPDTSFQVPPPPQWYGLLPDMAYTWRMRVSNAGAFADLSDPSWSPWVARTFRTPAVTSAAITLVSPANSGVVSTFTPTLQWVSSRTDIFYYEVQLSKDLGFNTDPATATAMVYGELRHGGVTNPPNSYTVPESFPLEHNTTYYWRVRPRVQGDATPVEWGPTFAFKMSPGTVAQALVYAGPGSSYPVVAQLSAGIAVTPLGRYGDFVSIQWTDTADTRKQGFMLVTLLGSLPSDLAQLTPD